MQVYKIEHQAFVKEGTIFAKVYTPGCNLKCGYCFVPEVVSGKQRMGGNEALDDIKKNQVMQGVCITGGEPTIQADLPIFLKKIQLLGLKTMIETNGTKPEMIRKVCERKLCDYIVLDVKAPREKYNKVVGLSGHAIPGKPSEREIYELVMETMGILEESKIPWEAKTVWTPDLEPSDMGSIAKQVRGKWVVVPFEPGNCLDPSYNSRIPPWDEDFLESLEGPREIWVKTKNYERRLR